MAKSSKKNKCYALLIDGLPWYIGDEEALPLWAVGRQYIAGLLENPVVSKEIDPFGGIGTLTDITFKIGDVNKHVDKGGISWVDSLRFNTLGGDLQAGNGDIRYDDTAILLNDVSNVSIGDYIYAPLDTWEVKSVDSVTNYVTVDRFRYSCTENPIKHYYRKRSNLDYTLYVGHNRPLSLIGRWIALYKCGELSYIGVINEIEQNGPIWGLKTSSLMTVIRNWKLNWEPLKLLGESKNSGWWVTDSWIFNGRYSDGTLTADFEMPMAQGYSYEHFLAVYGYSVYKIYNSPVFAWTDAAFTVTAGLGGKSIAMQMHDYNNKRAWANIFDETPNELHAPNDVGVTTTRSTPLKRYGFLTKLNDSVTFFDIASYVEDRIIKINDYIIGLNVNQVKFLLKSDLSESYSSIGMEQDTPFDVSVRSFYSDITYGNVLKQWLTDPNGTGLGLPNDLVNIKSDLPFGSWVDFTDGINENDLRAFGLCVYFDGGIKIAKITAPEAVLSKTSVYVPKTSVKWGRWSPLSELELIYRKNVSRETIEYAFLPIGQKRTKMSFNLKYRYQDEEVVTDYWREISLLRLRWLASFLPTIEATISGTDLELGDVVTIESPWIASGRYGVSSQIGIVLRKKDEYDYRIALNPMENGRAAIWAPSFYVNSFSYGTASIDEDPRNILKINDKLTFREDFDYTKSKQTFTIKDLGYDTINETFYLTFSETGYADINSASGYISSNYTQSLRASKKNSIIYLRTYLKSGQTGNYVFGVRRSDGTYILSLTYNETAQILEYRRYDATLGWTTLVTATGIVPDAWYDIIIYEHNGTIKMLVNSNVFSGTSTILDASYDLSFVLGFQWSSGAYSVMQKISEAIIWAGVGNLDDSSILDIVNNRKMKGNMVLWWFFDGSTLNVLDKSNNNNDVATTSGAVAGYLTLSGNAPHFTLLPYTQDSLERQQKYVYASDVNGLMSNGDQGKVYR